MITIISLALVIGACGEQGASSQGTDQAQALEAELAGMGFAGPAGTAAGLFGEDGGHICAVAADPQNFGNEILVGHRFALRKTKVSPSDIAYARAVVDVYCPEDLATFDEFVDGLATGETSDD
jgi:hypothetical protein